MKGRSLVILVVVAMLVGGIGTLPASVLRGTINTELAGVARVENVDGTIWVGEAVVIFDQKQMPNLPQTFVEWRFAPRMLLSGAFGYAVKINKNSRRTNELSGDMFIGRGLNDTHMKGVLLTAPAAAILPLLNPNLGFGAFSGQITLSSAEVSISPSPALTSAKIFGNATLNWRNANSLFLLGAAANEYQLDFDGRGAESAFILKTISGPMAAEGQGTRVLEKVAPYNAVKFNGRAKLPQSLLSRMGNVSAWLGQIGRMDGDQLTINWNGRL